MAFTRATAQSHTLNLSQLVSHAVPSFTSRRIEKFEFVFDSYTPSLVIRTHHSHVVLDSVSTSGGISPSITQLSASQSMPFSRCATVYYRSTFRSPLMALRRSLPCPSLYTVSCEYPRVVSNATVTFSIDSSAKKLITAI